MWVVRELARLLVRIATCLGVALAIALALAAVSAGAFHTDARVLCIVLGCVLIGMAGVGTGSNIERYMDMSVTKAAWGTVPGFDAFRRHPEDPALSPGAAFFLSGLALVAIGLVI